MIPIPGFMNLKLKLNLNWYSTGLQPHTHTRILGQNSNKAHFDFRIKRGLATYAENGVVGLGNYP